MKILVIEDNPIHQEAAKNQLGNENELTIISSFTEYFNAVRGIPAGGILSAPTIKLSEFDMVLTDVNLPSPNGDRGTVNAATGLVIALHAIREGVKMIGILTDVNHHDDAYSKALDLFNHKETFASENGFVSILKQECLIPNSNHDHHDHYVKNWKKLAKNLIAGKSSESW